MTVAEKKIEETNETNEELEIAAFNAASDEILPESVPNPLGLEAVEKVEQEQETGDVEAEEEPGQVEETAAVEEIDYFLGEMTADQVLEQLQKVDGLEDALYEKVSQRMFGKFGEIGQQLKSLEGRDFKFDPEKLAKLREVDEDLARALGEDLSAAFTGQTFDQEKTEADLRKSVLADVNPYVEQRLLTALVPDAQEIAQSEEFSNWFFNKASGDVRETFTHWDEGSQMDGVKMAKAFGEFSNWKTDQVEAAKQKKSEIKETLNRSVDSRKRTAAPTAGKPMTEEEAFEARTKEINR